MQNGGRDERPPFCVDALPARREDRAGIAYCAVLGMER